MKRKILITLSIMLLATSFSPITAFASDYIVPAQNEADYPKIQPYANISGYIYKIYKGKQWKRLWSYTYHKWEEPAWTLA